MNIDQNRNRSLALATFSGLCVVAWSCSSGDSPSLFTNGAGAAGDATAGTGGAGTGGAGTGRATAGTGGAGTGRATAGTGGATAGTGEATAGTGGATAGTGEATAGTGRATAGTGGATAETGGATAETGGATAETGGTSGSGGESPCGGCAVITAPLVASDSHARTQIYFGATDLSGVTMSVRACVVAGNANSSLQLYAQDAGPKYYLSGDSYNGFGSLVNCSDGWQEVTLAIAASGHFNPTAVTSLTVQVLSAGAAGPWVTSVVRIDSITLSGGAPGPWLFASNASALTLNDSVPVGSTITWIP